jgi:hypothetical protein
MLELLINIFAGVTLTFAVMLFLTALAIVIIDRKQ